MWAVDILLSAVWDVWFKAGDVFYILRVDTLCTVEPVALDMATALM